MDVVQMALSRALTDQNLAPFLELNVEPAMVADPDGAAVLKWVLDYYKTYRGCPSPTLVQAQFPAYVLKYAPDKCEFYVGEILKTHARNQSVTAILTEAKSLSQGSLNPFDLAERLRSTFQKITAMRGGSRELLVQDNVDDRWDEYEKRKNGVGLIGIPTGYDSLDDMTQGWQPEMYAGIAARPKTGKTFFLLRLGQAAYRAGYDVDFYNLELADDMMNRRFDACAFELPYERFRTGMLSQVEEDRYKQGLADLKKNPPARWRWVHGARSVSAIGAKIEEGKPKLVIVDGAYLLQDDEKGKQQWERQQNISRGIKRLAQAYKVPVIISIQLARAGDIKNRTSKNGVQQISAADVAGSDAYAQDVDILIGLEQTDDMRQAKELDVIPLATRDTSTDGFRVSWDFDTMHSEDLGVSTKVVSTTTAASLDFD